MKVHGAGEMYCWFWSFHCMCGQEVKYRISPDVFFNPQLTSNTTYQFQQHNIESIKCTGPTVRDLRIAGSWL